MVRDLSPFVQWDPCVWMSWWGGPSVGLTGRYSIQCDRNPLEIEEQAQNTSVSCCVVLALVIPGVNLNICKFELQVVFIQPAVYPSLTGWKRKPLELEEHWLLSNGSCPFEVQGQKLRQCLWQKLSNLYRVLQIDAHTDLPLERLTYSHRRTCVRTEGF